MDSLAKYNKERWEELASANIQYSRPMLDLDTNSARKVVDPEGILDDINGKKVLCLAGGGGQQSAAFGLLGAEVTVIDISETQLERDRKAAKHYNLDIKTVHGDMRDLSCFPENSFDITWHAHSLNFVPDTMPVFQQVARVIKKGGYYRLQYTNPFIQSILNGPWTGEGYLLKDKYIDGEELNIDDPFWDVENEKGEIKKIKGPREFRHTLGTVINNLVSLSFNLLGFWEDTGDTTNPKPGTWDHFKSIAPPWLTMWWKKMDNV